MSVSIGSWDPARETFQKYNDRRNQLQNFGTLARTFPFERYTIAVEHDSEIDPELECMLHAYVLCNDCWQKPPGLVDPRAMVLTGEIVAWMVPRNQDLVLGGRMVEILAAIVKHEVESH